MSNFIARALSKEILKKLIPQQVIVLYGARRVGKTTLIENIKSKLSGSIKYINAENSVQRKEIDTDNVYQLEQLLKKYDYLIIDEAQQINQIGQLLKIIVDNVKHIKILVSGSASFELSNQIGEPLTGRKRTLILYSVAVSELHAGEDENITKQLEDLIIYGSYPKIFQISNPTDKQEELMEVVDSYLCKDILILENIKNSAKLRDLLVLLALQIGSEVSLNELSLNLKLHISTVEKYLDLLEKVFVIYKLRGFSRNLRKEVGKTNKYYFYDNGIRNALINNFNPLKLRNDVGGLWENFLMTERMKLFHYKRIFANRYFWRTYDKKEIDLIEEYGGHLYAWEFKYGKKTPKPPKEFLNTYQNSSFGVVDKSSYLDFLLNHIQ